MTLKFSVERLVDSEKESEEADVEEQNNLKKVSENWNYKI